MLRQAFSKVLYPGINDDGMASPIPTKLEKPLIEALDRFVAEGLYQSRSEAIRDAIRRLVESNYLSRNRFLRIVAEISAQTILNAYLDTVTDIILYGSVASGIVTEESDIDILVLLSTKGPRSLGQMEVRIHETVYPIALAAGVVITPIALDKREFLNLARAGDHFVEDIIRYGIAIQGATLDELRKQRIPEEG